MVEVVTVKETIPGKMQDEEQGISFYEVHEQEHRTWESLVELREASFRVCSGMFTSTVTSWS